LFDPKKYNAKLSTQWLGQSLIYFEELDSTNTYMKSMPAEEVAHGQICLADHQLRGRGQYERNWETEDGKNLTFTLAFKPSRPERFHVLTLACARAAIAEIEDTVGQEAVIKWPNDVIVNQKKVGGLLTETVFNGNALDRLLIGIGLNVNQQQFSDELQTVAGSLRQVAGRDIDRETFLSQFLGRLEYAYTRWLKRDTELVKSINQKMIGYGQWVQLHVNGQPHGDKCKLLGINQKGALTGISKEGDLETFSYEQIRVITD